MHTKMEMSHHINMKTLTLKDMQFMTIPRRKGDMPMMVLTSQKEISKTKDFPMMKTKNTLLQIIMKMILINISFQATQLLSK